MPCAPRRGSPRLLVGASPSVRTATSVSCTCSEPGCTSKAVAQGQPTGTLLQSPPHRQFFIHRCSHCFTAVVLLGDFSMVTQPHLGTGDC